MRVKTVRRKPAGKSGKSGLSAKDHVQNTRPGDRSEHLSNYVRQQIGGRKSLAGPEAERNCRIKMAARNMPECIYSGQNRKSKSERYARVSYTDTRNRCRDYGASASAKHQPQRSKKFSR